MTNKHIKVWKVIFKKLFFMKQIGLKTRKTNLQNCKTYMNQIIIYN
jgi:hypothetical protein